MGMFAALAGMGIFAIVMMVVVGVVLGALVLCLAYRMVVGFMPSYVRALCAVVIGMLVSFLLRLVLPAGWGGVLSLVVNLLVGGAVINYLMPAQDGQQIGFGKGVLVQLVYLLMFIVLMVVLGFVLAIFFGSMLFGSH